MATKGRRWAERWARFATEPGLHSLRREVRSTLLLDLLLALALGFNVYRVASTGDLPWYYLASLPLVLLSVGYGQFSFWHQVYATLVRPEGDVGPASPSALPPRRVAW